MTASFLNYLQFEKRASAHSLLAYQSDLRQFEDFLQTQFQQFTVQTADHFAIRAWIVQLVESGMHPASVNRKMACLRSYYKYLRRQNIIQQDPMTKIRSVKTPKRLPVFVRQEDMIRLLDQHRFEDNLEGWRDKLILELFYATGIRLSELLTLRDADVDLFQRTIKVLGKRNKERVIPFPASLVSIIESYRMKRDAHIDINLHGLLLVTDSGDRCYPMMIYRKVHHYLQATASDRKSPHVLRHTFATHLLDKGAEINAVKDLLGHSSLAATQVYTHNSMEKLKRVFEQAHPKA